MDETNERIDLGELKPDQSVFLHPDLFDMPEGDYRIYAERIVEDPLNVRMAERLDKFFPDRPRERWRMQALIEDFDLVERSKLPDPIEVPEWMQRWLDSNVPIGPVGVSSLKAWIREALVAGAVRVEKHEVPEDVVKAAERVSQTSTAAIDPSVMALAEYILELAGGPDD